MKALVAVKRVVDFNVKVRLNPDGSGVALDNVKMSMNPFDEIAVEEAVRLKEAGIVSEVIVVSIGEQKSQDTLRTALAVGADRGIHVDHSGTVEPLGVAKALAAIAKREETSLVLMGKQAIDDDMCAAGQMLSAILGWSQGTFASGVDLQDDHVVVTREVDGGLITVKLNLPVVLTVDLRLNEPRYPSLPNIMKARRKPLETLSADDLSVDLTPRLTTVSYREPAARKAGIIVADAHELVSKLRDEAKVLTND